MELHPIISAMRRNKVGAILIAVQMAVTLAILCNALFIIEQRVTASKRPSGVDEPNVFVIKHQWVGDPTDLSARLQADLAALRAIPSVVDAFGTNSYPLGDGGSTDGISNNPDGKKNSMILGAVYLADTHGLDTLGVKLVAGRNFNSSEVIDKVGYTDLTPPRAVIITRDLAEKLFPGESALGKPVYGGYLKGETTVVGVIERLQVPWSQAGGWGSQFFYNSIVEPFNYVSNYSSYVVRAKPGQLAAAMKAAQKTLIDLNRGRVLEKIQPLTDARKESYKDDDALAVMLGVVCAALLLVTGFGIVGLTSYWVAQRRRQIGIRRALGASRQAIVRYFQAENLLIAAAGAVLGVALAIAVNLWMVTSFEMQRLHYIYAIVGAIVVLLLGQIAVLWPALRAASVPPALATRSN